jgi:hypothetical protein
MRLGLTYAMATSLSLVTFAGAAQEDKGGAGPSGTGSLREGAVEGLAPTNPPSAAPTTGRSENRWRYRFAQGRWWYWTPDRRWWYFEGSRWVPYREAGGYSPRKVDPALLRLEAKEGVLGTRKWTRRAGGAVAPVPGVDWAVSGTRGSIGGAPTSSFTTPSPVPRTGAIGRGGVAAPGGWRSSGTGGTPRGR